MLRWFLLLLAAASLVTGCSSAKLVYSQLDWLVPAYVEGYVDLDASQRALLDSQVEDLLDWHCAAQLHEYAIWMRTIGDDFRAPRVGYRRLANHEIQLRGYWREIARQATPRLSKLLQGLSEEQLEEFFARLRKDHEEFREDYVDGPLPEVQKRYARQMERRLKPWLRKLTEEQKTAIAVWSRQIDGFPTARLHMRLRWQSGLRQALRERGDLARLESSMHDLLVYPERLWSTNERLQLTAYQHGVLRLLEDLSATLSASQREHLRARAAGWADDLDDLACRENQGGESLAVLDPTRQPQS